jgi:hypothetical protein
MTSNTKAQSRRWAHALATFVFLISGVQLAGCREGEQVTVETVKAMIQEELPVGASSADIEKFLEKHGLQYTFDKYHNPPGYSSIIRNVSKYILGHKSILIFLYVDEQGRFTSSEVTLVASAAP